MDTLLHMFDVKQIELRSADVAKHRVHGWHGTQEVVLTLADGSKFRLQAMLTGEAAEQIALADTQLRQVAP